MDSYAPNVLVFLICDMNLTDKFTSDKRASVAQITMSIFLFYSSAKPVSFSMMAFYCEHTGTGSGVEAPEVALGVLGQPGSQD